MKLQKNYIYSNKLSVHEADDFTIDEAIEFVGSIDVKSFEGIQEFFEKAPKLTHTLKYTNSMGNDRSIVLQGVADFF